MQKHGGESEDLKLLKILIKKFMVVFRKNTTKSKLGNCKCNQ